MKIPIESLHFQKMDEFLSEDELSKITNDRLRQLYFLIFDKGAPTRWRKSQIVEALKDRVKEFHLKEIQVEEDKQKEEYDQKFQKLYSFNIGDIICAGPGWRSYTYFYKVTGFTKKGNMQTVRLERKIESMYKGPYGYLDKVTPVLDNPQEKVTFRKCKDGLYKKANLEVHPGVYNDCEEYFDTVNY